MSDLHVAVGVIRNDRQQILIAKRPAHVHMGGLWEFPGGKVEAGESIQQALQRELCEELGITFQQNQITPLIKIRHEYPDKSVLLDVWVVDYPMGVPIGRENQLIRWINVSELASYQFPDANRAIINKLRLPSKYLITGHFETTQDFLQRLRHALTMGINLVQFRAKELDDDNFFLLAKQAIEVCHSHGSKILVNTSLEVFDQTEADGIHLTSTQLFNYNSRPIDANKLLIASCHEMSDLIQAHRIGVDAIVLGPVKKTTSHPDVIPLGWKQFSRLAESASLPVYALGGLGDEDVFDALQFGAHGVAAISAWWIK